MPHLSQDLQLITASTGTPVTLEEAKDHLRVTDSNSDADITRKLRSATDYCQRAISGNKQFMGATFDLIMEAFPFSDAPIELPMPPLKSVTSVGFINSTGGSTTMPSTDFITTTPTDYPGRITPAFNATWPSPRQQANAVTIRFVAGYDTAEDVPDSVKQAVLLKLEQFYDPARVDLKTIDEVVGQLLGGSEYGNYK